MTRGRDDRFTWTEEWRHACEVRYVAALPSLERRRGYLEGVAARRGPAATDHIRADLAELWKQRSPDPHGN